VSCWYSSLQQARFALCLDSTNWAVTGGPAFLTPLHASGAILGILTNIPPTENPPQIVVLALRALHSLADAALLAAPPSTLTSTVDATTLAELLFAPRYMDPIHGILSATSSIDPPNGQVTLTAELICKLCREEQHQNALANAGVLDALATILASSVVAQGHVVPGAEIIGRDDGLADMIPKPASPTVELAPVLGAISAIVGDSRFRACLLLCSPAIMAIFPSTEFSPPARDSRTAWNAMEMAGFASLRTRSPGAIDYLLPVVPIHPAKAVSSQLSLHFPSLAYSSSRDITYGSNGKRQQVRFSGWDPSKILDLASSNIDATEVEEPESPLIPWLIHQVGASTDRLESIMHAAILTVLWRAGFVSRAREQSLGVLVVPPLVQTLESGIVLEESLVQEGNHREWSVLEQGANVLSRLVADSELLQTAAVECGGDKVIAKLLRQSYEPMLGGQPQRMWSPTPGRPSSRDVNGESSPAFNRLGPPGQTPLYAHRLRLRESALKAMAALISLNQDVRKVFVTLHDVMPFISESLYETPSRPRSSKERNSSDSKPAENSNGDALASRYGRNPNAVLISACHIVRLLSRSVSILRTSLADHEVATPLFKLLRHPDIEVQIAACGAVCNLVVTFSPMREVSRSHYNKRRIIHIVTWDRNSRIPAS
jgi:armadillo repeat-containing protein 8